MKYKFKTLLVTDDLKPSEEGKLRSACVRRFAVQLAQHLEMNIELFHAIELMSFAVELPVHAKVAEPVLKEQKAKLKNAAAEMGSDTEVLLFEGAPISAILDETRRNNIEMVVQGSQAKRGLKRAVVGSVAEEIIRHSKIPVVTLGPSVDGVTIGEKPRILVATDLGKNSKPAENYAIELAKALGAEIILSHCPYRGVESGFRSAIGVPYTPIFSEALYQRHVEDCRHVINDKAAELIEQGVPCEVKFNENELFPGDSLLKDIQQEKPFLLIMGTHGRNLFSSTYFGSTTREMLLSASVPVMTVRSF